MRSSEACCVPSSISASTTAPTCPILQWSRRGYDVAALENLYTGENQVRVSPESSRRFRTRLLNPSVDARIRFLRQRRTCAFHGAGVFAPRAVVSRRVLRDTPGDDREAALRDLRDGKVSVVFCVDLFNEGVDVPEIDTVLFLRPTESKPCIHSSSSAAVSGGTDSKPCLTVLDFIGGTNRRFRFDLTISRSAWRPSPSEHHPEHRGRVSASPVRLFRFSSIVSRRRSFSTT